MAESDIYNAKREVIEKKRAERKAKAEADWNTSVKKHNANRIKKSDSVGVVGVPYGLQRALRGLGMGGPSA